MGRNGYRYHGHYLPCIPPFPIPTFKVLRYERKNRFHRLVVEMID